MHFLISEVRIYSLLWLSVEGKSQVQTLEGVSQDARF